MPSSESIVIAPISINSAETIGLINKLNAFNLSFYSPDECHLESPKQLENSDAKMMGAFSGETLVGIGAVKPMEGYAEIKRMFVEEAFRGQGVAEKILKALEETAQKNAYEIVRLETGSLHTVAKKFYERMGYYRIKQFGNYPINDVSVLMEKKLKRIP